MGGGNSMAPSRQANYIDWAIATCLRNLVSTFVDRGALRGQRGGSHTVVNLSFLDQSHYFSFARILTHALWHDAWGINCVYIVTYTVYVCAVVWLITIRGFGLDTGFIRYDDL
jgi:hypothetical protein